MKYNLMSIMKQRHKLNSEQETSSEKSFLKEILVSFDLFEKKRVLPTARYYRTTVPSDLHNHGYKIVY